MKEFDLTNKVAVITGGSRGIGLAAAKKLAACGAACILVSRKKDALASAVEQIEAAGGKAAIPTRLRRCTGRSRKRTAAWISW